MWTNLSKELKIILVIWLVALHLVFIGLVVLSIIFVNVYSLGSGFPTAPSSEPTQSLAVPDQLKDVAAVNASIAPCDASHDALDQCANGVLGDATGPEPEVLATRDVVAPAVSIAYAPVPEPMQVRPTATPTREAAAATPMPATPTPTIEVSATATPTLPTSEPTATATMESPQVEIEPTVTVQISPTPESEAASTESAPVIPPCTPYPGSDKNPCERRVPWEWPTIKDTGFVTTIWAPWPPYTAREWVDWAFDTWITVPHVIVRGVPVPGSTRCATHKPSIGLKGSATDELLVFNAWTDIDCYTDIAVREYVFGSGPSVITYTSGGRTADEISDDFGEVERDAEYFAEITSPLSESLEGYEWVFWLVPPLDASQAAWDLVLLWDVQRLDDGTVVAVSESRTSRRDNSKYLDKLEPTLESFVTETKAAMAHYVELYDGRVGESPDAPLFLPSADLSSVYEYIKAMGALEVPGFTYKPPPPSPLASSATHTGGSPVVAPCTPYPGSDKDPCERRVPWEWPRLKNPTFVASIWAPWPPYTVREWVDRKFEYWDTAPHSMVRGVAVPGSTRCMSRGQSIFLPAAETELLEVGGPISHIDCYTDIDVREYIFGSGPRRVTFLSAWRPMDDLSPDFGRVNRDATYFDNIASPLAESLEGYEWVIWLAVPLDASQAAWKATSMWDVQRRDDGAIVGVSRFRTQRHDDSEYLGRLEPLLGEFIADAQAAMAHHVELYDGRVGESPDAPMLSPSADLSSVYEYIKAMGALEVPGFTYKPPPPSPRSHDVPTDDGDE